MGLVFSSHKLSIVSLAILFLAPVTLASPPAAARPSNYSQTYGNFGWSVSVGSLYTAVGAPSESSANQSYAGNVYIYNTTSGVLIETITSPNPQYQGLFGYSVSVNGRYLLVSALQENSGTQLNAGNAYIFNLASSALLKTFTSPNPVHYGSFGNFVSLNSKYALIGAPREPASGIASAGNAYMFNAVSGALISTLNSPDMQIGGYFGWSGSIGGKFSTVGAPFEASNGQTQAGNAYVFSTTSGGFVRTLMSPNPQQSGTFGFSVSTNSKYSIVSAPGESSLNESYAGNAYVFNSTSGAFIRTFTSPNVQFDGGFGFSVALGGSFAVVGAPNESPGGLLNYTGRAYIFNLASGALAATLSSGNSQFGGFFGYSVSLNGRYAASGAPWETSGGFTYAGNAYIYKTGKLLFSLSG